jgi:hypothetical protein
MEPISVSPTSDYFVRGGKPFFYLADTIWSAFTNITLQEWEEYLNYRKMQGFNALQIDILPQWDRSHSDHDGLEPFEKTDKGLWNFHKPNAAYFDRAKQMTAMAYAKGFIPALTLLWCNYVEGTWGAQRLPGNQIPQDAIRSYVQYVCQTFAEYQPIFLVSGDTDLKTPETIKRYLTALKAVKEFCPAALTTFHLNPPTDLPEEIAKAPELDFYMYQSGHIFEEQANAYILAQRFYAKPVKRPVVNGEPCYEGHGFGFKYGRFSGFHVRRAVWQSLLSGAKAGFTYGAHGIWGWHTIGTFPGVDFSGLPYPWRTALRLQGAWDVGFIKWIFEMYNLFEIEPTNGILNDTPEIRMASTPDGKKVVIYIPFNTDVQVKINLNDYDCLCVNLTERLVAKPEIQTSGDGSVIKMHDFNADVLVLGFRKT